MAQQSLRVSTYRYIWHNKVYMSTYRYVWHNKVYVSIRTATYGTTKSICLYVPLHMAQKNLYVYVSLRMAQQSLHVCTYRYIWHNKVYMSTYRYIWHNKVYMSVRTIMYGTNILHFCTFCNYPVDNYVYYENSSPDTCVSFLSQTFASNIFIPDTYLASHDLDGRKKIPAELRAKSCPLFCPTVTNCGIVHKYQQKQQNMKLHVQHFSDYSVATCRQTDRQTYE
jgi:hypothetical protein